MKIDCPKDHENDFEEQANIEAFSFQKILKHHIHPSDLPHPNSQNKQSSPKSEKGFKRQKKGMKLNLSQCREITEEMGKPNYLNYMFKENIKKFYINLFVKKLKQIIVRSSDFNHSLLQEEDNIQNPFLIWKFNPSLQIVWNIIITFYGFLLFFYSTLALAFEKMEQLAETRVIALVCLIIQCFFILSKFFTQSSFKIYTKEKNLFLSQHAIKYLQSSFPYDLLVFLILALDSFNMLEEVKFLRILLIFKMISTYQKIKKLQIVLIKNFYKEQYWQLFKVILFNFLFAHLLSVFLILMANIDSSNNWIAKKSLTNLPWHHQYIWAYYWGTTIMLTVGFGDFSATTTHEALAMIFIEMLSCIVLTYNINSVGNILRSISSYETEKQTNTKIFMRMQDNSSLSEDIKSRIMNFITESSHMRRKYNIEEEQKLINSLPQTITEEYYKQVNFPMFSNLPFFKKISERSIRELASKIERKLAHPEEIILTYGNVPSIAIFTKGQISLNMHRPGHKSHGRKFQTIKVEGSESKLLSLYFIYNKVLKYDVKCCEYSVIYLLKMCELLKILKSNPCNYQNYMMMKDKDRYNRNQLETLQCQFCGKRQRHTLYHCSKFHYIPINQVIINKQKKSFKFKSPKFIKNIKYLHQKRQRDSPFLNFIDSIRSGEDQNETLKGFIQNSKSVFSSTDSRAQSVALKDLYHELTKNIRDEISKVPLLLNQCRYFEWPVECDIAFDFQYYFVKDNPSNLKKKFEGRQRQKK